MQLQRRVLTQKSPLLLLTLFAVCYLTPSIADVPKPAKIELGIGLAALQVPHYPGAAQSSNYFLPLPFMVYRGDRIQASRRGISGRLFSSETAEIDIGLAGSLPVNSTDNDARRDMNDLDITGEFGPRLKLCLFKRGNDSLWLHLPLRAMASTDFRSIRYQGWKFAPGLRYVKRLPRYTFISAKLETGIADRGFHDYFYGVNSNEVIVGEREAYKGRSGYTGTRVGASLSRWWDNWRAFVGVSLINIEGTAYEDSPLVRQANGVTLSAGFTWTFYRSKAAAATIVNPEI